MGFLTEGIINCYFRKEIASVVSFQYLTSNNFNLKKKKKRSLFIMYNRTGSEVIDIPLLNQKTNSPDSC